MTRMAILAAALSVFGGGVYLAGRYASKAIGRLVLILATIGPIVLECVAVYQFYMAFHGSHEYAFADMGFAIVTLFNLIWLPAMWWSHRLGRRHGAKPPLP
ncbi:MAG TPA: hypothetical protein VF688_02595 [Allosphingosinicella sp.]|jgi:hypothetical protein